MIYKLVHKNKVFYAENIGETHLDRVKIPKSLKRFRFWLWLTNPNVLVYRYKNYKWECVFNYPYRKLND